MSTYKIDELPPICHHMQIIILASMLEAFHRDVVRQPLDPSIAREHAIQYTMADQTNLRPEFTKMVQVAYQHVIRIWMAMDDLGLKWDKRPIKVDNLVFMGLSRSGATN